MTAPTFREPGPRAQRRIERMRTQRMGHAQREAYRVSGRPDMSRPGIFRPDATLYLTGGKDR